MISTIVQWAWSKQRLIEYMQAKAADQDRLFSEVSAGFIEFFLQGHNCILSRKT